MQKKKMYVGLSDAERSEIEILIRRKCGIREIARTLGRSPNTISREIQINGVAGAYVARKAKQKSRVSQRSRRYQWRKIEHMPALRAFVIEKLAPPYHWSPDEIDGHLQAHPGLGFTVGKTQLYAWLYSSYGQPYCQHLYARRYRPRKRSATKTERAMIPERIPIQERPVAVQDRTVAGAWEFDSVVSSKQSGSRYSLAVTLERSTRYLSVCVVPNLKPAAYAFAITNLLHGKLVTSLTTDNGIENKAHAAVTAATGAAVYFTDPYSSWQKGGVENGNKMLRRYFPKGTDFSTVTQNSVDQAVNTINNKPRRCLGYKSALELAVEKGVI
jgi:IS30 family transposase